MDETFSSIDLVTQCLTDDRRTEAFKEGIEKVVKPDDVVLDSGTGSAILALFAARAGAKKVVAVEYDPYVAKLAEQNIKQNGYSDRAEVVVGDIRQLKLDGGAKFDVVIMEMLTTGMVDEYQVWAINSLHENGLVKESTTFIPKRQDTYVELVNMDFDVSGFNMRMVRHLWESNQKGVAKPLTDCQLLNSISFDKPSETTFSWNGTFEITNPGVINGLRLTSKTIVIDGVEVGDTLALNAPVVVPFDQDYVVQPGDHIECDVRYHFGNGYRNFKSEVRKV